MPFRLPLHVRQDAEQAQNNIGRRVPVHMIFQILRIGPEKMDIARPTDPLDALAKLCQDHLTDIEAGGDRGLVTQRQKIAAAAATGSMIWPFSGRLRRIRSRLFALGTG